MKTIRRRWLNRDRGFALLTVTIFALILTIAGASFFAMSSYETKGALYRENSSEAFYLADGGYERAKAHFLTDGTWRAGYAAQNAGRGTYDVVVRDTTWGAEDKNIVKVIGTGHVSGANRRVEVVARLAATAFGIPLLVMGEGVNINGNLCLDGDAHFNADSSDLGHMHISCGGTYSDSYVIIPPPVYTEPSFFPGANYYYVKGVRVGPNTRFQIWKYDGTMHYVTNPDSANGGPSGNIVSYNSGSKTFAFNFSGNAVIDRYFNESTGFFKKDPGARAAVVSFGDLYPADTKADVFIGQGNITVRQTILNTHFIGATLEDRHDASKWWGGGLELKALTFEPRYGIVAISKNFATHPGGANLTVGTEDWPALLYITGDVTDWNANGVLTGSVICLGNWNSTGGIDIHYNGGFFDNLPQQLQDDWPQGTSATAEILRWRELGI